MNVESSSHTLFTRSCDLEFSGSKMSRVELMTTLRVPSRTVPVPQGVDIVLVCCYFANHVVFFYAIHLIITFENPGETNTRGSPIFCNNN